MTKYINPSHVWDTYTGELEIVSGELSETISLKAPASYIIFKDGDMVKARNGETGMVDFSGADATTIIQQAIDALENGGRILIKKGTYIDVKIVITSSDVEIVGEGYGTYLVGDGSNPVISGAGSAGNYLRNIRIANIRAEYGGGGEGVIAFDYLADSLIEKVWVGYGQQDSSCDGIDLDHSRGNVIRDVVSYYNGGAGIHLSYGSEMNVVMGCRSYRDGKHMQYALSAHGSSARENLFIGNIVIDPYMTGIEFRESGEGNRAIANSIHYFSAPEGEGELSIIITNSPRSVISHNLITYEGPDIGRAIYAIQVADVSDAVITGNVIIVNENVTQGIRLYSVDGAIIRDNIVKGGGGGRNSWGILMSSCQNVFVEGNVVIDWPSSPYIHDYNPAGPNKRVWNKGALFVNGGTATISAGSTSVTVSHGLVTTPSRVFATPIGDPGDRYWVANITDTSFDIVVATAPSTDIDFCWEAEV